MPYYSQRVVRGKRRGFGAVATPFVVSPERVQQAVASSAQTSTLLLMRSDTSIFGRMLQTVRASTDALIATRDTRTLAGEVHHAKQPRTSDFVWRTYAPADPSQCNPLQYAWVDVWIEAARNLRVLSNAIPPRGTPGTQIDQYVRSVADNIALLDEAANVNSQFFWLGTPRLGYESFNGRESPGFQPAPASQPLVVHAPTAAEAGGSYSARGSVTDRETAPVSQAMSFAPIASVAGALELLGEHREIDWWYGKYRDRTVPRGTALSALPEAWFGAATLSEGYTDPRATSFHVPGVFPGAAMGVRDHAAGVWLGIADGSAFVSMMDRWSQTGEDQLVAVPIRQGDDPSQWLHVVVRPGAYLENLRARAQYLSRIDLLPILDRVAGFYANSYIRFGVERGLPLTALRSLASSAAVETRRITEAQAGRIIGTVTQVVGAAASVASAIPVVGTVIAAFAAVYIGLLQGLNAILVETQSYATGSPAELPVLPFRRIPGGACATTTESYSGAADLTQQLYDAGRASAAAPSTDQPPTTSSFPWLPILGGVAVAGVVSLLLRSRSA